MLRQASISDLITDRVSADRDYVVITMRRYPRFISKKLRQEYLTSMSPDRKLFEDWLSAKRKHDDHEGAFACSKFEERFTLDAVGLRDLERLSELSREKDVYLVCQCPSGGRCHREMLLILAKKIFNAPAEAPKNAYPVFSKRASRRSVWLGGQKERPRRPPEAGL